MGKVGKRISGEESVAERNQWDPGTGWESLRESGSVMFSCEGEVGERQRHKAWQGWGNSQEE